MTSRSRAQADAKLAARSASGTARRHVAILVAGIALFLSPAWLGGGLLLARDGGRMHAPVKRFLASELAGGHLPEWNPYLGLGMPVVGAAVDAVQHPFTLLLLVLPAEWALTAWVLLSVVAAALGASWWARVLGASRAAGLVAGFGFALAGPIVSATDNVTYLTAVATLPAFFAAAHLWIARGGPARLAALAGLSYLLAAAGDAQSWGFAALALPVLAVGLGEGDGAGRRLLRGVAAAAVATVAAAPVLLPLALWLPHSSRAGAIDAVARQRWSLAPVRLLEIAVPHLLRAPPGAKIWPLHVALADSSSLAPWAVSVYLGATALVLAAFAALRDRRARLLLAAVGLVCWMALGDHAGFGGIAAALPILRGLRYWEKMAPWAALFLAQAAALAVDRLDGDALAARRLAAASAGVAALALAGALLAGALPTHLPPDLARDLADNLRDGFLHAAAFSGALAAAIAVSARRGRSAMAAGVVAVVALDLAAANVGAYELHSPAVAVSPGPLAAYLRARPGIERVVTPFEPLVDRPGLTADESSNLLGARTLASAWNVGERVGNFDTYTGAAPARADEIERRLSPDRLLPVVGLWGVAHVVVPGRADQAEKLGLRPPIQIEAEDPTAPAWLVAVPHRPRAYLASRVREASADEARAFALDPASAASDLTVVEGVGRAVPGGSGGEVVLEVETSTSVRLAVRTATPALLVLNDAWAPGWTALVDGAPVAVLRANYLVRSVEVPAGLHRVIFRYRTPGLLAGWLVAAAGGLALVAWHARRRLRSQRGGDPGRAGGPRGPIRPGDGPSASTDPVPDPADDRSAARVNRA
ncbi:YfhO family protein [Anaeromyxobacter oryzae]|uniref:YfhO family protein n=1 Tax=Anaeromyxobacter oryzae TaxID=2918170 RepID=A0ABN6MTN8_9BACT|nr:YfhO family protein [Anaeromyxobacter oryzae]BDG04286.1 hypothetical protein AMOR_32820 [Anaeromyxobacter oryzae]